MSDWRSQAIPVATPDQPDAASSSWRSQAVAVPNSAGNIVAGPANNVPQYLIDYLGKDGQGVPADLLDIGATPGNAIRWADLHLRQAEREQGSPLSEDRMNSIMDIYKSIAGRDDLSSRNFFGEQRERALRSRRETLGGRILDAGAAYNRSMASTGTSLLGLVAPERAAELQRAVDATYATDEDSRAAFAGGLTAEGVKLATIARAGAMTGAPGLTMAGVYGAQGAGGVRTESAELRRQGREIGTGEELLTAAGVGGAEAISGFVGAKIFGAMGRQLEKAGPSLTRAFGLGGAGTGREAVRNTVSSVLKAGGLAVAEGAEEGVTQLITNKIRQQGINPEQAVLEGVGDAILAGMILSPLGAGAITLPGGGQQQIPGASVDPIVEDMIRDVDQTVEQPENRFLPPPEQRAALPAPEARFVADPAGNVVDRSPQPGETRFIADEEGGVVDRRTLPNTSFQPDAGQRSQPQIRDPRFADAGLKTTAPENIDPRTQELVTQVQSVVGDSAQIRIVDSLPGAGGMYNRETGTMYVRNGDPKSMVEALIHESMHASGLDLESEIGSPRARRRVAREYLTNFREFARRTPDSPLIQEELQRLETNPVRVEQEAIATMAGRLANDPTFAAQLSRRNPNFVQRVVMAIRRAINSITGRQRDIDTLAGEMLARIEQNTGVAAEPASAETAETPDTGGTSFLPDRQTKIRRTRLETHQADLAELRGKRSRATGADAQGQLDAEIARKRAVIAELSAGSGRGTSFLPDNVQVPGRRESDGRFTLPQGVEDFISPISTRLANISGKLYQRLIRFELRSRVQREDLQRAVGDFLRTKNKKLSKAQQREFTLHVSNGDMDTARDLLRSVDPGLVRGFDDSLKILDSIYAAARRAGVEVGYRENYWPREVRDYKEWRQEVVGDEPGPVRDAIALEETRRGRKLTEGEEIEIANRVLQGYGPRKPGATRPKAFRGRSQERLTDDMLDLYWDADHAIMGYINRAVHAIEKARLFGKGDVGEDIVDSIGRYTAELVTSGEITADQERTVKDLLASRFTSGEASPSPVIRTIRDVGYLTVLANPISAVTQFGDLFLAGYRSGVIPALRAVASRKRIRMESLGIERIAAEFSDPGRLSKVLDGAMKASGFQAIDRLGKETLLNAALRKFEGAARRRGSSAYRAFERQYKPIFGEQFEDLASDLASDRITENVRLLLFMELSGVQPISLSEMPKKYLDAPNGRLFYMLKTFTIKQLDMLRRNAFAKINRGDVAGGSSDLIRYALIFGIGNATADIIKDWLLGRDVKWTDLAIDGLLRLFGGSKFLADSSVKDGPGRAFFSMLLPPTGVLDDAFKDVLAAPDIVAGERGVRSIRNIPMFGKLMYWRVGEGRDRAEREKRTELRRREAEVRDQAIAALDENDRTSAQAIIKMWNEQERPGWMDNMTLRAVTTSRRSRIRSLFTRTRDQAAEAILSGDRGEAQSIIDQFNAEDPPRPLTMQMVEGQVRRMQSRGRTE